MYESKDARTPVRAHTHTQSHSGEEYPQISAEAQGGMRILNRKREKKKSPPRKDRKPSGEENKRESSGHGSGIGEKIKILNSIDNNK